MKFSNTNIKIKIVNLEEKKHNKSSIIINEPMSHNRYVLSIPTENGINEWFVQNISRPAIIVNTDRIPSNSSQMYNFIKSYEWQDVVLTIFEPIGFPSFSITEWCVNSFLSNRNLMQNVFIKKVDPTGVIVEEWLLNNVVIVEYNNESHIQDNLTIKLRPSSCSLML